MGLDLALLNEALPADFALVLLLLEMDKFDMILEVALEAKGLAARRALKVLFL